MRKRFFLILAFLIIIGLFFWQKQKAFLIWNGQSQINFVLDEDRTMIVSLEPSRTMAIIIFPDNLYLNVPHGYGKYQLGSVYQLGELENQGGALLMETLQNYLALPIQAFIRLPGSQNCSAHHLEGCLFSALRARGETNLNFFNLLRLWWQIKYWKANKITIIDLNETRIPQEIQLADGTVVLDTEFTQLDELLKKDFLDYQVRVESLQIEILNATKHSNLAHQLARLIENSGGRVISVGNASEQITKSKLQITNEELKNAKTVQKLEKVLGVEAIVGEMSESRADLLIILAADYYHHWYQ